MDPIKEYSFSLPERNYGNLPQGMIWERFLDLVGKHLGYRRRSVAYAGASLSSGDVTLIKGSGGVGNRGCTYRVQRIDPSVVEGELDTAVNNSIEAMKKEKPGLLKRTVGALLYSYGL